jgi:acetyl esterase/lipase
MGDTTRQRSFSRPRSGLARIFSSGAAFVLLVFATACGIRGESSFSGSAGWNTYVANSGGAASLLATGPQTASSLQTAFTNLDTYVKSAGSTAISLPQPTQLDASALHLALSQEGPTIGKAADALALPTLASGNLLAIRSVPTLQANPTAYFNIDFTGLCGPGNYADLYLPGTAAPPDWNGEYPLVVIVHGGGWANPGRIYMAPGGSLDFVTPSLYRGLAVLNVDYGPAGQQDIMPDVLGVMCQTAWMRYFGNIAKVSNRAAVGIGHSAGGHIVALIDAAAQYASGAALNGAVVLAGVADLATFYTQSPTYAPLLSQNFSGDPTQQPQSYAAASATGWEDFFHGTGFAPIQWWHGRSDTIVPYSQCQEIAAHAATNQGTTCNLVNDDHSFLTNASTLTTIYQQALGQGAYVAHALGVN